MFGTDHLACESYQLIKWNLFIIKTMGDVPKRERERERDFTWTTVKEG